MFYYYYYYYDYYYYYYNNYYYIDYIHYKKNNTYTHKHTGKDNTNRLYINTRIQTRQNMLKYLLLLISIGYVLTHTRRNLYEVI